MTIFSGVRCPVASCEFNRPGEGVVCGWLTGRGKRCRSVKYREVWQTLTEAEAAQEAEAAPVILAPRSLAGRATAASKPLTGERARQLILNLEGA